MNPTPSQPERPEPCKTCGGTRKVPALVETATGYEKCPYIADDCPDYATRTAPEAVAGEAVCNTCVDNSGYIPVVHGLSNDGHGDIPCPDCNAPTPPAEADKDAEKEVQSIVIPLTMFHYVTEVRWDGKEVKFDPPLKVNTGDVIYYPAINVGGTVEKCMKEQKDELTTARATIAERDEENARLSDQVSQMAHLLNGGELTIEDVERSGLGRGVLIDQKHAVAERDKRIAELVGALNEANDALRANQVFHTPIALSRKTDRQWDEYEADAINRTKQALANAAEGKKGKTNL